MKKVKLHLSHAILISLSNDLLNLIEGNTDKTIASRIYLALWAECWVITQEKGAFHFQGERKVSFTMPRALALMAAIHLMKPETEYEQAMYLEIIGKIDQQTV